MYLPDYHRQDPNIPFLEAVLTGNKRQALLWFDRGAAIDGPAPSPHNPAPAIPLIEAARNKRPEMIDWLLNHGANIKKSDHYGDSALHKAASVGDLNTASILIDRGAPLDAINGNRSTPLHAAALRNDPDMTKLLVQAGANPNQPDRAGQLPWHLSQNAQVRKILQTPINNVDRPAYLPGFEDRAPEHGGEHGGEPVGQDRIMMQSLHYMIQNWRDRNPGIDTPKPEF